jgi:TrwC relaxase
MTQTVAFTEMIMGNPATAITPAGKKAAVLAVVVTIAKGYDLGYIWKTQDHGAERAIGGYYINAAQVGEPPGRWWGPGAQALGLAPGQTVQRQPYDAVYRQTDPRTGARLGRPRGRYPTFADHLARLQAAEPHATAERLIELEREAAWATRQPAAYYDVTISFSKSISILHASLRENERRARIVGDQQAAAYWAGREQRFQEVLHRANRAALEYLQAWAGITRTGYQGTKVDGREPGRFEPAGLIVTSWLQGTSREGDPQDHVHNQIARVTRTFRDGEWRALDTMSVRTVLGALQAVAATTVECELSREFGVAWTPRADGRGNEIKGISQAQMDAYSTRTVQVREKERELAQAWTHKHGRAPTSRELLHIANAATLQSRKGKDAGAINWDALALRWDATLGGDLAGIAPAVSDARGPGGPIGPEPSHQAPGQRAAWYQAFHALSRADGPDVRAMPDGRLWLLRDRYAAQTGWAPRHVGKQLRLARLGAFDAALGAIRADAEAQAARKADDPDRAARHEHLAASYRALRDHYQQQQQAFAQVMAAREKWEQATAGSRRLAIAADAELRRRHPYQKIEPLRSAEPAPVTDTEHEQAHPAPGQEISQVQQEVFRATLQNRQALRAHTEDSSWSGLDTLFSARRTLGQAAILQPPKLVITPSTRILERAAEHDAEPEAGG